jgi:hypothetical protein
MVLLLLPLLLAPQHPVAVLRSGDRAPCLERTAPGDFLVDTPWGRLAVTADPVVEVVDPAAEAARLGMVREADFGAWVERAAARGLVGALVAAAADAELLADERALLLGALEDWGRRLDPVPPRVRGEDRVDWLWDSLAGASPAEAALRTGRLLAEIPAGNAPSDRRVGLVDLRRALRGRDAALRRAAARVGAHQFEPDLFRPLSERSLVEADAPALAAACAAMVELDPEGAVGSWTLALLRGSAREERARAAENLGRSGRPEAVDALMLAVASSQRAPGRYAFFGRQISLVTDFDVEVAGRAAIADPRTSVLTEGVVLEVRLVSTFVSRSAMSALQRLTGADPGPAEADWLRWYEEREAAAG